MHRIDIPAHIVEVVKQRRGTLHPFGKLNAESTALIVIDLQNAFVEPGQPRAVPQALSIIPNVNRLAEAVRTAGSKVVWIKMTLSGQAENWNILLDHFTLPADRQPLVESLTRGSHGYALHADLDVKPNDLQVEKTRFSAFLQGSSDLDRILKSLAIDTIIVTGTVTNVCCESTIRDAMMLNYKTVMVSDANACHTDEEHNATLISVLKIFGDVATADEVIARLVPAVRMATAAGD